MNLVGEDSESESETGEELDPILKRLPVFYTPHYLSSLTLLSYPDRPPLPSTLHPLLPPALRPTGVNHAPPTSMKGRKISVKYKPRSQCLEMTLPLDQGETCNPELSRNFGRAERTGIAGGPKGKGREEEEERELEGMCYAATVVPDATNYLVGVVKNGSSPLSSSFGPFRP